MSRRPVEIEYLLKDGVSPGLNQIGRNATSLGRTVESEAERINGAFKRAAAGALAFFSIQKATEYGRSIIQIRGEMQGLSLAFETMLGSKAKADKMMSDIVEFAMGTPYTVTEVADNVKQLIAMNAAGDDVMETFKSIGDVAAGVNVPISRIAINYGQVAALGKLQQREIRDFAMAGIPIVGELAKQFGVAEDEIMAMVEAGQIGFPAVQKAFASMSGEGGRVFNMMEKLNSTVTGQLSRLQDAIQQMMNKIGESNEGMIYKGIDGASYLIENYEKIGRVLGVLIASYGTYRAALIATVAIQKISQAVEWIRVFNQQTAALSRMTQAQILLNKAVGANPYVKLASILMTVGGLIWAFAKNSSSAAQEVSGLEKATKKATEEFDAQHAKVKALTDIINGGNVAYDARKKAIDDLKAIIPDYNASISEEGRLVNQNTDAIKAYLTQLERQIKMKAAQEELEENYRNKRNQERDLKRLKEELSAAQAYNNLVARPAVQSKIGTSGMQAISMGAGAGTAKPTGHLEHQIEQTNKAIADTNKNIQELNDEINATADTGTSTTEIIVTKNKAFWETQKKDAEAALEAMEDSAKGGEEWKKQMALLNEATAKLQTWDFKGNTKAETEAEKTAQKLIDLQIKLVDDAEQAKVDAMAEGLEKTLAQNKLNHRREVEQIERFGEELLKAYQSVNKNITELPEADRAMLANMTASAGTEKTNSDNKARQSESERLNTMLKEYQTYQQKMTDIAAKYAKERENVTKAGGGEENIALVNEAETAAVEALDLEYAQKESTFRAWMNQLATQSLDELKRTLEQAEKALAEAEAEGGTGKELAAAKARVAQAKAAIKKESEKATKETDAEKQHRAWQKLYSTLRKVASEFDEIGEAVGGTAGEAIKTAGTIATSALSGISAIAQLANWSITATQMAAQGASAAIIAVEKASVILAVIGAIIQVVTAITGMFKDNEEQLRAAADAAREYETALKEIERTKRLSMFDNVFGTDGIGKFQEASKIAVESMKAIRDQVAGGMNITATFDGRSGWNKFWGSGKHKIKNYAFDINEFINTDGTLKMKELQAWYKSYEGGLEDWEKKALQDLIANGEAYEEAIQAMTDHIDELWGSLASSIADNMIDAFLETGDAAKNLGDLVDDVAKNMAKSMIESLLIEDIFNDDLQKRVLDLLKIGDQEGANALIQDAIESAGELAPIIEGIIESLGLTSEAAEKGVNQSGKAGTFTTMSQDTGTELKGLFVAMRMGQEEMNSKLDDLGPGLAEATGVLIEIREEVKKSNGWLGKIFEEMKKIVRDGLKMQ